jgi:hypothetical protein
MCVETCTRSLCAFAPRAASIGLLVLSLVSCQTEVVNSLEKKPCPSGGMALAFDGIAARVTADLGGVLPTGNSARTVELWVYTRPSSWEINIHTIFEYGIDSLNQAFAIDMDPFPRMQIYSWDDDLFFPTGLDRREGWFHVAATYDGTTLRAFINGTEQGSKVMANSIATQQTEVRLAWSPFIAPEESHFDGMLDEVRIWNVARTPDEIKESMSRRLTGDEPWLVAYWRFDEGEGTIAHDASSRHHDARLNFGPMWVSSAVVLRCE